MPRVMAGGVLQSRKGLSLPHTSLKLPSVTDKDQVDAAFAVEQQVDYFALSFVRCDDDVEHLRAFLGSWEPTSPSSPRSKSLRRWTASRRSWPCPMD